MPPKDCRRCVVYWTQDKKAGIEPISNVPANARFEGSVTTVMFSGDKRWYPAKVMKISDDIAVLNAKEEEIAQSIAEEIQSDTKPTSRSRKSRVLPNVATEHQLASALGTKPPVPKNLNAEQSAILQAKKDFKLNNRRAQDQLDKNVLNKIRVNLFDHSSSKEKQDDDDPLFSDGSDAFDELDQNHSLDKEESDHEKESSFKAKWCDCTPCATLEKYDNPTYLCLLKDIIQLIEGRCEDSSPKQKYLKLKPVPEGVRQVELTIGSGIHLSRLVKDQLKVDFHNKPSGLVRETLFALYGREPFKTLTITARGNRLGTYGIEEGVLTALTAFINRHVEHKKKMKVTQVVATINKRVTDWRTKTPSPKPDGKFKRNRFTTSKVISTSPFKVVKLTPSKVQDGSSPVTSPIRTSPFKRISSPFKKTPTPNKKMSASKSTPMKQPSPRKSPASKKQSPVKRVSPAPASNVNPSMASSNQSYFPSNYPPYNHQPAPYPPHPHPSPSSYSQPNVPQYNYWSHSHEYPPRQGWSGPQESDQPTFTNM